MLLVLSALRKYDNEEKLAIEAKVKLVHLDTETSYYDMWRGLKAQLCIGMHTIAVKQLL